METNFEAVLIKIAESGPMWPKKRAARLIGWSETYFDRGFRKRIGVSFRSNALRIRMERAAELLRTTQESIEYIAVQLGYSDRFAFEKAFKRVYGVTPGTIKSFMLC